jgi:UDP-glucose:(heptosyl)LPS alpha-1,3-glucosyltransferase
VLGYRGLPGAGSVPNVTDNEHQAHPARPLAVTVVANDIGAVGGMERVLGELVTRLRDRGHDVTVIARTCELPLDRIRFRRVPGPRRPFLIAYPWFMLAGALALRRHRRGVVLGTGAVVLARVDAIAVHYCHQVGPATPSRTSFAFRANVKVAGLVKRLAERVCYRLNRHAAYPCVSAGVAQEMRAHFPYLAERVTVIHNGVDTAGFAPGARAGEARELRRALGIGPDALVAAFVGRSEWERKGLEPLLRALSLAPGWEVVVAGSGDEAAYQRLADSLGVGSAVHWLGVRSDVELVYALADAFVLPSSYETFSLVTFEAAACGLPVLATPVSGVAELIEDGANGFSISRDPELIAERLLRLAADPGLRERLGRAARESALSFGWEEMVDGYERLLRGLAGGER